MSNLNPFEFQQRGVKAPISESNLTPNFFKQSVDEILEKTADPNSISYTPIGDKAILKPAGIQAAQGLVPDEVPIILQPHEDTIPIYRAKVDWGTAARVPGARHDHTGEVIGQLPVDPSVTLAHTDGTPNMSAVYLDSDGHTIKNLQPLHIPKGGEYATAKWSSFKDGDLLGDRTYGAHGGSQLSSLDNSIKVGELVPGGKVNHALNLQLWGKENYYYDPKDNTPGYRWPATRADAYASKSTYGGGNSQLEMGALLALPKDFDMGALKTEPAKMLAETLMTYGGYVVDDTAWDVFAITTETGPGGDVQDEFKDAWGFKMNERSEGHPWRDDINTIFTRLHTVTNNGPNSVGGGHSKPIPDAVELEPVVTPKPPAPKSPPAEEPDQPGDAPTPGAESPIPKPSGPEPLPTQPEVIRINAGGGAFTDGKGNRWTADRYAAGGRTFSTKAGIAGTSDDALFQSERYQKNLSYDIPVENGSYEVNLTFAEIYWSAAGKRLFDLKAEGKTVIDDLDIYAEAGGKYKPLEKTVRATVTDGNLDLDFETIADNAKVSAIEIVKQTSAPTPKPGPDPVPSPTPAPDPAPADPIRVQAEDMALSGKYRVESIEAASGRKVISLNGGPQGEIGRAAVEFSGPSGTYDVKVAYFDEIDGVSSIKVKQEGKLLDSFKLDQMLGSAAPDKKTLTSRKIAGVEINTGDVFKLRGAEETNPRSAEYARIDYIEFVSTSGVSTVKLSDQEAIAGISRVLGGDTLQGSAGDAALQTDTFTGGSQPTVILPDAQISQSNSDAPLATGLNDFNLARDLGMTSQDDLQLADTLGLYQLGTAWAETEDLSSAMQPFNQAGPSRLGQAAASSVSDDPSVLAA
ncbi:MAG: malectin domain-containing carbohydrate-binding protein [Elainellaceae cyanobacterium]